MLNVAQETFLKAYRNLRNFAERSGFLTWLHTIAATRGAAQINPMRLAPVRSEDLSPLR